LTSILFLAQDILMAFLVTFLFLFNVHATAPTSLFEISDWLDVNGKTVSLTQWKGRPIVATMVYTNCRKICPRLTIDSL